VSGVFVLKIQNRNKKYALKIWMMHLTEKKPMCGTVTASVR